MTQHLLIVCVCVLALFINSLLIVGSEWTGNAVPDDNAFILFGLMFVFASIVAVVVYLLAFPINADIMGTLSNLNLTLLLLLIISSTLGLPTTFLASRSALGASRTQFVDYSMTPLFTLAVGISFEDEVFLTIYTILGIAGCFFGCFLIIWTIKRTIKKEMIWPKDWNYSQSVVLGVICAIVSAICGAFNLLFVRRLVTGNVSLELILLFRFLPCGIILLVMGYYGDYYKRRIGRYGLFLSACLATLLFLSLWLLARLLKEETLVAISPFLLLIPVFTFLLSLYPFRLRRLEHIPLLEIYGMALIITALVVSKIDGLRSLLIHGVS